MAPPVQLANVGCPVWRQAVGIVGPESAGSDISAVGISNSSVNDDVFLDEVFRPVSDDVDGFSDVDDDFK